MPVPHLGAVGNMATRLLTPPGKGNCFREFPKLVRIPQNVKNQF